MTTAAPVARRASAKPVEQAADVLDDPEVALGVADAEAAAAVVLVDQAAHDLRTSQIGRAHV